MAHQNRLASSSSPYLLQHANNPVDWYPWGAEALERARREEKPILLSIGYAACHWCHVMEHESFENEDIARLMNERFVNIKVDREERPDLDQIYQLVVQLMGRSGGWPLTVFLMPDQRPFFAGTYFPPVDRFGMPGFPKVLSALSEAYESQREDVEAQALQLTRAIAEVSNGSRRNREEVDQDLLRRASHKLITRFDDYHGGFGSRPKFPNTMALEVLLRRGVLEDDEGARKSVRLALDKMRAGGIWDQLRGGFHRYSTDERWLVPHFEKMLYDNALLLRLYVDAFRAFGASAYAETARAIVRYLFAEMRDECGGFYASQDADSEGEEGRFFVFTPSDLKVALGDDALAEQAARLYFGVTDEGNFEDTGATVLSVVRTEDRVAAIVDQKVDEVERALARAREKLLAYREARPRPSRDDKILASWNGLLIGALADAGRALDEPSWIEAAAQAFGALEERLVRKGRVGRYIKDRRAASDAPGFLDDQAYLGNAALDLFEATGDARYARLGREICEAMVEHHWDKDDGGFFFAPDDGDALIARTKDAFDQAIPSAASMAALLCLRIGEIADAELSRYGEEQLTRIAASALENPFGMGQAVLVLDRLVRGATMVVIVGASGESDARALADVVMKSYAPNRSLVMLDPSHAASIAAAPLAAEGKLGREGQTSAYLCRGRSCSPPVTTPEELAKLLRESGVR